MSARVVWLLVLAAAVGLPGCWNRSRDERPLGTLTPAASPAAQYDSGTGAAGEEMNPVQVADPVGKSGRQASSGPPGTLTRPDQDASYEARLRSVELPVNGRADPLVVDGGGSGDTLVLVNTVLAEVNGEVITREDILGPIRTQMTKWRQEYSDDEFRERCRQVIGMRLREEISRRLVLQEAKADLSEEEKKQIDMTLGKMLKDLTAEAGSALLLEEKIKARGSSVEEQREQQRERLIVQRYLRKKVGPRVHITHSELLGYYNEVKPKRYVRPTRVRLGLITIRKDEAATPGEARSLAEAVRERAVAGEDFARLARRYSRGPMAEKGGDWGFIGKGAFRVQQVNEVLFGLDAGEVGPVVEADDAFHVVKALERDEARTVPFTEVQSELEDELRDREFNRKVEKYIQELYKRGYVRVMEENL